MTPSNKNSPAKPKKPAAPTERQVEAYLGRHPEFFVNRRDLLSRMTPPERWKGDGIVDLQKTMLDHLRGEVEDLKNGARDLIETSRSNLSSQSRVHAAVLAMLAADGLNDFIHAVTDQVPMILGRDVATIGFEPNGAAAPAPAIPGARALERGTVDRLLGADGMVRLIGSVSDDGELFGAGAGLVRSAALARLKNGGALGTGLLALGARGEAFDSGQGTELLGFLADATGLCLRRWLAIPN
ncbi:MAG: DUF484 family protein [Rhodospirillales bacterium]|nr:DUF484 family protein [Rhodospirillales bacterium]